MIPFLGAHIHGQSETDFITLLPGALKGQIGSLIRKEVLPTDCGLGVLCPSGNAQTDGEGRRLFGMNADIYLAVCGIIALHLDADFRAADRPGDLAGRIALRDQPAVLRRHPKVRRELRPALMQVRHAAAEVRLQPEHVCVLVGVIPIAFAAVNADLVDLLVVLMRPAVGGQACGQRIVGQPLPNIAQRRIVAQRHQAFKGIHHLHHSAGFRALRGVCAGEVLIAGEHAQRQAVRAHELCPAGLERLSLLDAAVQRIIEHGGLERHGQIHHMGVLMLLPAGAPRIAGFVEHGLEQRPGKGALLIPCIGEGVEITRPINGLLQQFIAELEQRLLAGDVVEPLHNLDVVSGSGNRPQPQRLFVQIAIHISKIAVHKAEHALIAGGGKILLQALEHDHARPPVLIIRRAEETILPLRRKRPFDKLHRGVFKFLVAQLPGQRQQSVQIIRAAFPALALTAHPGIVPHAVPDAGQVAGDGTRHHALGTEQVASGLDGPHGQRRKCIGRKRRPVEYRLIDHGCASSPFKSCKKGRKSPSGILNFYFTCIFPPVQRDLAKCMEKFDKDSHTPPQAHEKGACALAAQAPSLLSLCVFFRCAAAREFDLLHKTDELSGQDHRQQRHRDTPEIQIGQRQQQHDQIAAQIDPTDIPIGNLVNAHGQRVISAGRSACAHTQTHADADEQRAQNRRQQRPIGQLATAAEIVQKSRRIRKILRLPQQNKQRKTFPTISIPTDSRWR